MSRREQQLCEDMDGVEGDHWEVMMSDRTIVYLGVSGVLGHVPNLFPS